MQKSVVRKFFNWHGLTTEQLSSRVFYILIGVTVVLFCLFRFVGFDIPYDENPDYNAPLFTGIIVSFMLLLTVATLVLMVWGMAWGIRKNSDENKVVNNIPARRISLCVATGFVAVLLVTFAFSDATPIRVNGSDYTDAFWLRMAGMFVGSSLFMIVAAVAAAIFGATRYIRK